MKNFTWLLVLSMMVAVPSFAQGVTQLSLTSSPDDYIGQGQTHLYTTDCFWTMTSNYDGGVDVIVNHNGQLWQLYFSAPNESLLVAGDYPDAQRWPFQNDPHPGLSVLTRDDETSPYRVCTDITGSFVVHELSYNDIGEPVAFWVSFTQYCGGGTSSLSGELLINASVGPTPTRSHSWGQLKARFR